MQQAGGWIVMLNLYDAVRCNPSFNKLEIGEFLFAEYTCPVGEPTLSQWTHVDFLIHVLSGKKVWHTADGAWTADAGDTLFFRKGASIIEQFFDTDFCLLLFFIPDRLIRTAARKYAGNCAGSRVPGAPIKSAVRVKNDAALTGFFQCMRAYFSGREKPSEPLLRLKLDELVLSILTSSSNPDLATYFQSLASTEAPSLVEIMEANFRYRLSLAEYAALCHRSLASFKRDFLRQFQEPPGRWLVRRRLEHAAALLRSTNLNVTEAAMESGFEDMSHFSRVFKARFQIAPRIFRQAGLGNELSRSAK